MIFGIVVPDICNPVFAYMYKGIEQICSQTNYSLMLGNSNECKFFDPTADRYFCGRVDLSVDATITQIEGRAFSTGEHQGRTISNSLANFGESLTVVFNPPTVTSYSP